MAPCLPATDQAELLSDRQHRDRHDPEPVGHRLRCARPWSLPERGRHPQVPRLTASAPFFRQADLSVPDRFLQRVVFQPEGLCDL